MGKSKIFTEEVDEMIIDLKEKGEPYLEICKKINERIGEEKYTPRKICQRWANNLNTNLCHEPLDKIKRKFILKWIKKHKSDTISWKDLILAMEIKFGKVYAGNTLKNYYYCRERKKRNRATHASTLPPLPPTLPSIQYVLSSPAATSTTLPPIRQSTTPPPLPSATADYVPHT